MDERGGGSIKIFRRLFLKFTVPKNSRGGSPKVFHYFQVPKNFG